MLLALTKRKSRSLITFGRRQPAVEPWNRNSRLHATSLGDTPFAWGPTTVLKSLRFREASPCPIDASLPPPNAPHCCYRASGLTLVVAAIILWNTVYLSRAIQGLKAHGLLVGDNLLEHLSSSRGRSRDHCSRKWASWSSAPPLCHSQQAEARK
jgi:hypothetical protein